MEVIKGQYFNDLMDQPRALGATLSNLKEGHAWSEVGSFVKQRSWRRIVLTGMGSSFHMLHPLHLALISAGYTPIMMETSELIHYGLKLCTRDTLIVLVSQSGRSVETVRLLESRGKATVLGVTNTQESYLAQHTDLALVTQAGSEFSVSCKTYLTGIMVLQWLSAAFRDGSERDTLDLLAPVARVASEYLSGWASHVSQLYDVLTGAQHLLLIGRGGSLSAAGAGALIIKESAHFHAEGMSSAAFRHGPLEMLSPGTTTIVFRGDSVTQRLNDELAGELVAGGFSCEMIGAGVPLEAFRLPSCDFLVMPILEILPVQMMTLALAALAKREAGKFQHASKVTTRE